MIDMDPVILANSEYATFVDENGEEWNLFIPVSCLQNGNENAYLYDKKNEAMSTIQTDRNGLDEFNDFLIEKNIKYVDRIKTESDLENALQFAVIDRLWGSCLDRKELITFRKKVEEIFPWWDLKEILVSYYGEEALENTADLWKKKKEISPKEYLEQGGKTTSDKENLVKEDKEKD